MGPAVGPPVGCAVAGTGVVEDEPSWDEVTFSGASVIGTDWFVFTGGNTSEVLTDDSGDGVSVTLVALIIGPGLEVVFAVVDPEVVVLKMVVSEEVVAFVEFTVATGELYVSEKSCTPVILPDELEGVKFSGKVSESMKTDSVEFTKDATGDVLSFVLEVDAIVVWFVDTGNV